MKIGDPHVPVSGEVPASIEEMAQHAVAFIDAPGVEKIDAMKSAWNC
jgi:predicted urease superfamily metal-dependent hydrolase